MELTQVWVKKLLDRTPDQLRAYLFGGSGRQSMLPSKFPNHRNTVVALFEGNLSRPPSTPLVQRLKDCLTGHVVFSIDYVSLRQTHGLYKVARKTVILYVGEDERGIFMDTAPLEQRKSVPKDPIPANIINERMSRNYLWLTSKGSWMHVTVDGVDIRVICPYKLIHDTVTNKPIWSIETMLNEVPEAVLDVASTVTTRFAFTHLEGPLLQELVSFTPTKEEEGLPLRCYSLYDEKTRPTKRIVAPPKAPRLPSSGKRPATATATIMDFAAERQAVRLFKAKELVRVACSAPVDFQVAQETWPVTNNPHATMQEIRAALDVVLCHHNPSCEGGCMLGDALVDPDVIEAMGQHDPNYYTYVLQDLYKTDSIELKPYGACSHALKRSELVFLKKHNYLSDTEIKRQIPLLVRAIEPAVQALPCFAIFFRESVMSSGLALLQQLASVMYPKDWALAKAAHEANKALARRKLAEDKKKAAMMAQKKRARAEEEEEAPEERMCEYLKLANQTCRRFDVPCHNWRQFKEVYLEWVKMCAMEGNTLLTDRTFLMALGQGQAYLLHLVGGKGERFDASGWHAYFHFLHSMRLPHEFLSIHLFMRLQAALPTSETLLAIHGHAARERETQYKQAHSSAYHLECEALQQGLQADIHAKMATYAGIRMQTHPLGELLWPEYWDITALVRRLAGDRQQPKAIRDCAKALLPPPLPPATAATAAAATAAAATAPTYSDLDGERDKWLLPWTSLFTDLDSDTHKQSNRDHLSMAKELTEDDLGLVVR